MQPSFAISIHDIDAGGLARSFELPLPWLERAFEETDITAEAPGHADVRVSRTGHDVVVRGKVTATLTVPCARCIKPVSCPVDTELSLLLRPAKPEPSAAKHGAGKPGAHKPGAHGHDSGAEGHGKHGSKTNGAPKKGHAHEEEEYEFSSDEADQDTYDGETVVLDGFLREAILLEAPSFPLCSEDCPGIRPKPLPERGEPAIDPRLIPLRALKTKLKLAGPAGSDPAGAAAPEGAEGSSSEPGKPAAERPAQAGKVARPRIHAHRTRGTSPATRGSKQAKSKQSPKKKAK